MMCRRTTAPRLFKKQKYYVAWFPHLTLPLKTCERLLKRTIGADGQSFMFYWLKNVLFVLLSSLLNMLQLDRLLVCTMLKVFRR